MKTPEINIVFRLVDFFLSPFMWVLGGFTFPLQETHIWHIRKWNWKGQGLIVRGTDNKARFNFNSPFGLFHMPLFGAFTKYVVIEADGFKNSWYIGWGDRIQVLPIKQNRIKLLVGKGEYTAYGLGSQGKKLKLKIIGYGKLGDEKFKGVRLF